MVKEELLQYCARHDKIYCYGAGRYGREVCVYLDENGIKLDGFIISSGQTLKVLNVEVYQFANVKIDKNDGIIVAVGEKYSDEIIRGILERNIGDYFLISNDFLSQIENVTSFNGIYPNNQFVNVLLYHRVIDLSEDIWNISVSRKHFEEQMHWLYTNFPIISFEEDFEKVSKPSFVITFDDGYADNYDIALPVLQKYNIPATFFISSGLLDGGCFWWDELYDILYGQDEVSIRQAHAELRRMNSAQRKERIEQLRSQRGKHRIVTSCGGMSSEQLIRMAEFENITIGAHTITHSSLSNLSREEQVDEIKGSVTKLESLLQKKIEFFSYPHGDFNASTLKILKDLGIKKAATVAGGIAGTGNNFLIPRNIVLDQDLESFKKFIKRCFCVYSEVRN